MPAAVVYTHHLHTQCKFSAHLNSMPFLSPLTCCDCLSFPHTTNPKTIQSIHQNIHQALVTSYTHTHTHTLSLSLSLSLALSLTHTHTHTNTLTHTHTLTHTVLQLASSQSIQAPPKPNSVTLKCPKRVCPKLWNKLMILHTVTTQKTMISKITQ